MKHTSESEFILRSRVDAGLTQSQIAKALGYSSPQYLSNCERGLCALAPKKMKKFCQLTNVDANLLIHYKLVDQKRELKRLVK